MAKNREKNEKKGYGVNNNLTPGGPGRPKGQRNFTTIYREALKKIAELDGIDAQDLEDEMVQKAIASARSGDFKFYKDLQDRIHGKPIQKIDADVRETLDKSDFVRLVDSLPQSKKKVVYGALMDVLEQDEEETVSEYTPIGKVGLNDRAVAALQECGLDTLEACSAIKKDTLKDIKYVGKQTVKDIEEGLKRKGLSFNE